jgi:hypothetical protein
MTATEATTTSGSGRDVQEEEEAKARDVHIALRREQTDAHTVTQHAVRLVVLVACHHVGWRQKTTSHTDTVPVSTQSAHTQTHGQALRSSDTHR